MRIAALFAMIFVAVSLCQTLARAETRVALVIGNSRYQNVSPLPNPINDSTDMAAALKRLGFDVRALTDAKYDDMRRALLEFDRRATGSDIAVLFFAGHGMEVGGQNWLIPVDAELSTDTAVENEALSLRTVMEKVGKAHRLGLVILDACRNNPFAAKMDLSTYKRAVDRGFGRVEPAGNVLVAYAAKDGTTANDGSGRNSPFTAALLKNIEVPNVEVEMMFRLVRDDVIQSTNGGQLPFKYGSLSGQAIYLKSNVAPETKPSLSIGDPAAQAWAAAQNSSSSEVLEEFVRRYGDSFYAVLAKAKLNELKTPQLALNVPPSGPAAAIVGPCAGGVVNASAAGRASCALSTSQERSLKPTEAFKECSACPELVVIPGGSVTLGQWKKQLSFAQPFAVGKFHVTVSQFAAFTAETNYTVQNSPGRFGRSCSAESQAPGAPVVCLNWDDAQAYVDWLAKKTGKPYRLLSEAEFAYAAGNGNSLHLLEFTKDDWLADCYHRYSSDYSAAPTDGSVWTGGDCGEHLLGKQYGSSSHRPSVERESETSFRVGRALLR